MLMIIMIIIIIIIMMIIMIMIIIIMISNDNNDNIREIVILTIIIVIIIMIIMIMIMIITRFQSEDEVCIATTLCCPGKLRGLYEDTLDMHDLVVELLSEPEAADLPLEDTRKYATFAHFYDAAKRLAATPLAELEQEGLKTSLTQGNIINISITIIIILIVVITCFQSGDQELDKRS